MKMIAAADAGWGIGYKNRLLVSIPADLRFFRKMTIGRTIVMGRKTLESFPGGKPLRERKNIVLTSSGSDIAPAENLRIVHSLQELLDTLEGGDNEYNQNEIFCVGGASIYRLLLPYCDTAYITRIDHIYEADAFFPDLDTDPEWAISETGEEQTYFDLTYRFVTYRRKGRACSALTSS